MKIETQLPLGNLDPGLRAAAGGLDLARGGAGDRANRPRTRGRDPLPARPGGDGARRVDSAAPVEGPLYARPRQPGQGAYRASLRPELDAARPMDARLCRRVAGDLGMLAERRHQARL